MYIASGKDSSFRRYLTRDNLCCLEEYLRASDIRKCIKREVLIMLEQAKVSFGKELDYWVAKREEHGCDKIETAACLEIEKESDEIIAKMKKTKQDQLYEAIAKIMGET